MTINVRIKRELENYLQNRMGRGDDKAYVVSAYKMAESEIKSIQAKIPELKEYEIINLLDEKIIGGFIIKYSTKVIDLSLRGQLKNFKKIMYEID